MVPSNTAFVSSVGRITLVQHQHYASLPRLSRSPLRSTSFFSHHMTRSRPSSSQSTGPLVNRRRSGQQRPSHSFPVYASASQQEIEWNEVQVTGLEKPCEDHTLLSVNVGVTFSLGSLTDAYRVPGMYLQLRPSLEDGVKPAFLAISSPPTITGIFEFLIKDSESTKWISSLKQGDTVYSSPVAGKGFRFSSLTPPPEDVLLFATGSGIAPIRACIESILNGIEPRKRRSVTLFYGARTPQRMPYMDKFEEWKSNNVNVVPVISRPEDADSEWDGRTGYIQHALDDIGVSDPANTAALLCGVKGMTEEVRKRLVGNGVPEDQILMNF